MLLFLGRMAVLAAIEIGIGWHLVGGFRYGRLYVGRIDGDRRYVYRTEDPAGFNRQVAFYIVFMVITAVVILI